jgi:hypothetical protein
MVSIETARHEENEDSAEAEMHSILENEIRTFATKLGASALEDSKAHWHFVYVEEPKMREEIMLQAKAVVDALTQVETTVQADQQTKAFLKDIKRRFRFTNSFRISALAGATQSSIGHLNEVKSYITADALDQSITTLVALQKSALQLQNAWEKDEYENTPANFANEHSNEISAEIIRTQKALSTDTKHPIEMQDIGTAILQHASAKFEKAVFDTEIKDALAKIFAEAYERHRNPKDEAPAENRDKFVSERILEEEGSLREAAYARLDRAEAKAMHEHFLDHERKSGGS